MDTTTLTTEQALAGGAVLGGMLGAVIACAIAFAVLMIVAWWRLFTKAGEPGWKSLIPIYNVWVAFKIVGIAPINAIILFVGELIISIVSSAINGENGQDPNIIVSLLALAFAIYAIVLGFIYLWKLAKAYGRGVGTFIGLIFFPNIFALILAFGSAKYDKKAMYKPAK